MIESTLPAVWNGNPTIFEFVAGWKREADQYRAAPIDFDTLLEAVVRVAAEGHIRIFPLFGGPAVDPMEAHRAFRTSNALEPFAKQHRIDQTSLTSWVESADFKEFEEDHTLQRLVSIPPNENGGVSLASPGGSAR